MSSIGRSKALLEIGKFALYVTVPIVLTYSVVSSSGTIHKLMGFRPYVVYPPEGPRPPSPEELREMAREIARKNKQQ
ncbi:protein Pet [Canna indica]|uniref:Protein Pet n=1 Tax=Canna indica TaxID=4628 RepID=A0AAQ3PZK2_9LILI|nr:protein Pet [Canna indica]